MGLWVYISIGKVTSLGKFHSCQMHSLAALVLTLLITAISMELKCHYDSHSTDIQQMGP